MNYTKPFLSIPKQIDLLKSRGMQVTDEVKAAQYLAHINYVRLRPYWYPFEADHTTHQFKPDITFDLVLRLYLFDSALRSHLSRAIEPIEVSLRTQFAYHFSRLYGPFAYANSSFSKNRRHFQINLSQLQEEINRSGEAFINHYRQRYNNPELPPIWIACETISFGLLSRCYKNLRLGELRKAIANTYGVDNRSLDGILHNFTEIRNTIAHHGRLWDRNIIFRMPLPQSKPPNLRDSMSLSQQDRLYNSLVMILHFMDIIQPAHRWRSQLVALLNHYQANGEMMGFPVDWSQRPIWQTN